LSTAKGRSSSQGQPSGSRTATSHDQEPAFHFVFSSNNPRGIACSLPSLLLSRTRALSSAKISKDGRFQALLAIRRIFGSLPSFLWMCATLSSRSHNRYLFSMRNLRDRGGATLAANTNVFFGFALDDYLALLGPGRGDSAPH
jgi:hypothetical protein